MTFPRQDGDSAAVRDVFRFETFGNEGFWTDAVHLPQGAIAAGVTPLKALQLGLQVDMEYPSSRSSGQNYDCLGRMIRTFHVGKSLAGTKNPTNVTCRTDRSAEVAVS